MRHFSTCFAFAFACISTFNTQAQDTQPEADFTRYALYNKTAPRAEETEPVETKLPLKIEKGARIAFIGNTLLERSQHFGHFEAALYAAFPDHELVVRNLAWPGDTADLQPRPFNFADLEQHLTHEKIDIIVAAFGFNESFAGAAKVAEFEASLAAFVNQIKRKSFNGKSAPQVILLTPIANENVQGVAAGDLNNKNLAIYSAAVKNAAKQQKVGAVDLFQPTQEAMQNSGSKLTFNGCHLNEEGYARLSDILFAGLFGKEPPATTAELRAAVVDKNRHYFRRYRPLNTFYYTGKRNKSYGYLDFLPAMRNFDILVANRERRIWSMARGEAVPEKIDDSNLPELPAPNQTRGGNRWITAEKELSEFKIDPRFDVNLFAGEEEFPDIAAPIQMRWDSRGRLWVACSTTYPHVYPGNEPADKIVILEDTDGDGKADKSSVFADKLHIPLSFEFGDKGVYVSEMPHLTYLEDTNGDGKADLRRRLLTGFGSEDSHHALHDFTHTPDGDLIFRESIFHHSQVETPYGPVRQQNSGWFRYEPKTHRLTSFGTYHSTNPWGVTFDKWGRHVASHPIFAAAFHSLDPPYPTQHASPKGLRAYSGTCGQEFIDFAHFPKEMQGGFVKVRYKPTNRVEIHNWKETEFGYDEEYVSDLIFSSNLSFIPVDLRFGPRGALYVCDWYNPIKGHAQYSLRDDRRDRHSGRIWRIVPKGKSLAEPPEIADASIVSLLENLKRPEYRIRYWSKQELRRRDIAKVKPALDDWLASLRRDDAEYRHHQLEALWTYRWLGSTNIELLRELLACDHPHAREAATRQLRYHYKFLDDYADLLRRAANDPRPLVRMEAAIAASYIGTKPAFEALLDTLKHPRGGHVAYAITCALGSRTMRPYWQDQEEYAYVPKLLRRAAAASAIKEPTPSASQAEFDSQQNIKVVKISCIPERMQFTNRQFAVTTGQPVKVVFTNPDATDHNMVFVKSGALAEVGMAANDMAKDPKNADSNFVPKSKRKLIIQASPMIGPTRKSRVHVFRFTAPTEPGVYPYVCTFPGHWVVMNGIMVVADDLADVDRLVKAHEPQIVSQWKLADFRAIKTDDSEEATVRGMQAFVKARCNQCHVIAGHGVNLGPDLVESVKKLKGLKLLQQIIEPSSEINPKFQNYRFLMEDGRVINGVVKEETTDDYLVISNLLTPNVITAVKKSQVDEKIASKVSPMPLGLVNVLTREEIVDLVSFLESGGYNLPEHLKHKHNHQHK